MDVDEMSTIMFTNLQLLGLDAVEMEGKYKIPFNKDMFHLPNKAGSEAVLYFLFSRLNLSLAREQFRDCWPVIDKKTEMQFRKVCNNWLACIQKDEADAHMPLVNAALLLSPGGRKFIHMLYSFSTYVVVQVMKSEHGWKPQDALLYPTLHPDTSALGTIVRTTIQDSCVLEQNQFFERLHLIVTANRKWREYTDDLVKKFRGLVKSYRDVEHEKRQQVNITADNALRHGMTLPAKRTLTMFDSDRDVCAIKRGERIEKARSNWRTLSKFSDSLEEAREIVRSVLDQNTPKHILDGTDLGVRVPGLLLRECNKEIHKREIDNVYNGGRLNLVSLVLLWNICLKLYIEQLQTEQLPSVSSEIPHLSAQAHKHHSHLMTTQELREEMKSKVLPRLKHSIIHMQKKLSSKAMFRESQESSNELGLVLTTPTPPAVSINRSLNKSSNNKETPTGPMAGPVYKNDTPDAVMTVADKVRTAAQKDVSSTVALGSMTTWSGLLGSTQRFSSKEIKSQPGPRSSVKESNVKPSKTKPGSIASHPKKGMKSAPGKSTMQRPTAPAATSNINMNQGKQKTAASLVTPRTSKQKALDKFADSIVDSVLQSSPSVLTDESYNRLSPRGELDEDAFATKNLIGRSPIESMSYYRSEFHQVAGNVRPNASPVLSERSEDVHFSEGSSSPERLSSSIRHKHAIDNTVDSSQSFSFDYRESDKSNNAAVTNGRRVVEIDKHKEKKRKHTNLGDSDLKVASPVHLSSNLFETLTPEQMRNSPLNYKTGILSSKTLPDSTKKKTDRFSNIDAESATDDQVISDMFETSRILHQNFSSPAKSAEQRQPEISHRSISPFAHSENMKRTSHSWVTEVGDRKDSNSEFTNKHERFSESLFSSPRTPGKTTSPRQRTTDIYAAFDDVSPHSRQSFLRRSPGDISDRRPGDGEASADRNLQPGRAVPSLKGNSTKDKPKTVTDEGNSPIALSPFSDIFPTTNSQNCDREEDEVVRTASPLLYESKSPPSDLRRPDDLRPSPNISQSLLQNYDLLGTLPEEKLLDLDTKSLPKLIDLDSADEDTENEQGLNDSYVPFKYGICVDSRTPTKGSTGLTPSRISSQLQQNVRSKETKLSSVTSVSVSVQPSEDSIQAKLAALHQKVSDILGDSMENCEPSSPSPSPQQVAAKKWNQEVNTEDDDDLLSSELRHTDLLGIEDLLTP